MADRNLKTDEALQKVEQIPKAISNELASLRTYVDLLFHHLNSPGKLEEQQIDPVFKNLSAQVIQQNQQVANELRRSYSILEGEVKYLTEQIKKWQARFKLFYAKLGHQPDLNDIATRCATTGQVLHELISVSFEEWRNVLGNFEGQEITAECTTQFQVFQRLLKIFLQRTFVVTGQEEFVVRIMKKCFPTFCLRLLAADYMHDHVGEVTPYFVSEVNLRKCVREDELNIEDLKKLQIKVQNLVAKKQNSIQKWKLESQKDTNKMECLCKNIAFEKDFKRQQKKEIKVHEEKFRVVFVTEVESRTIWTMSLPLVVISASNQEVNSLASIMWQCFSTDVFSIHEETPAIMEWSSVALMLKMKFAVISQSYNLTDDNIRHLKRQLFGGENQPDNASVSMSHFICDPKGKRTMKNIPASGDIKDAKEIPYSFWKWFLGVFNVIEQYLSAYWEEGLIMAFAKRQHLKQMLLKCSESGTFVLRFSDTEIRDRDGVKNVHGRLKASVFCIKYSKETGKRKCGDPSQLFQEKVVEDLDLDDPPENLAKLLKEERKLFYRYLYPSGKTRQELFDKHYQPKENEDINLADYGYKKPCDVGLSVPDLEQAVKQLNLLTESSAKATPELDSESRVIKKAKRNNEQLISEEISNVQTDKPAGVYEFDEGPLYTEEKAFISQSSVNSSISPSYFEQSPEQSVPNFSFQANGRNLNEDSVVPYSPDNNLCTAMDEGGFASGGKIGTILSSAEIENNGGIASPGGEDHFKNDLNSSVDGASTHEIICKPLIGCDNLISGSRSDENTSGFQYEAGCQQLQFGSGFLERNTKLTSHALNELKQTLPYDKYMCVLSWTQKEVEPETSFPNQTTFRGEIPVAPNMEIRSYDMLVSANTGIELECVESVIDDIDIDHILQDTRFGDNDFGEGLLNFEHLLD